MRYSLYRVWKQLWNNKKSYWFIVFQMAIGIGIFVTCFNLSLTNRDTLEAYKAEMMDDIIPIHWIGNGMGEEDGLPAGLQVTYEDYLTIGDKYQEELNVFYSGILNSSIFILGDTPEADITIVDMDYLFMNDALFENTFGFEREKDKIYAGSVAYETLNTINGAAPKQVIVTSGFPVADNQILFSPSSASSYELLPETEVTYIDRTSTSAELVTVEDIRMDIKNCIICPVEKMADFESAFMCFDAILKLQYKSTEFKATTIPAILNELTIKNQGSYNFTVDDNFLYAEKRSAEQNNQVIMFIAVSVVIFIIVMVGMIGILLITLQKRKKEIAISYAFGSTRKRTVAELLTEVMTVYILGGGFGLLLSVMMAKLVTDDKVQITFYPVCILYVVAFCIIAAIICRIDGLLINVKAEEPAVTLKEL